jgi:tetratricopeptide (TPR) repeat protein
VLLGAYAAGGVDSVETRYRALRARFYGQAAYDFGDATLGEVAAALRARDRSADAMKLYLLNTRVLPDAPGAFRQLADAQLAAGDTAAAVTSLEQVVQLAPADAQAQRQLETLKRR